MLDTFTLFLLFAVFVVLVCMMCVLHLYVFLLLEFSDLLVVVEFFALVINSTTFVNADFVVNE